MSHWTHVTGTISVHINGKSQPHCRFILETVLAHLPVVHGSEENMQVYIVQPNDNNVWCSHDEFGERTDKTVGRHWNGGGHFEFQSMYLLVLDGHLRDAEIPDTKRELMKWLCRLAKRLSIHDLLIKVSDGYGNGFTLDDSEPFYAMNEWPSWCKESGGEPMWTEFLLWDCVPGTEYPLSLAAKYYADIEVDTELDRREAWRKHFVKER